MAVRARGGGGGDLRAALTSPSLFSNSSARDTHCDTEARNSPIFQQSAIDESFFFPFSLSCLF